MIYMGSFFMLSNQHSELVEDRRHGEFMLIVDTDSYDSAISMFRKRILQFRASSDFFEGECNIFLTQIIEIDQFPKLKAFMLNFKSQSGDPIMPYIGCSIPSEEVNACKIHGFDNNTPQIEGTKEGPFIKFSVETQNHA